MVKQVVQGKEYEVTDDDFSIFSPGTKVIALESSTTTDNAPWCVLSEKYIQGQYDTYKYDIQDINPMTFNELKEVEDNGNKDNTHM